VSCPHGYADGAYVLGALSPAERAEFEEHLAECPECAVAVGRLAPLPGLLGRVDPAVLEEDREEPIRLSVLISDAADSRQRQVRFHRWRLAVAAVVAALAAGGTAWWIGPVQDSLPPVADSGTERPADAENMSPVAAVSPIVAQIRVQEAVGGSTVWVRCHYPYAGYAAPPKTFRLVAVGADGSVEQLGSWLAGPGQRIEVTGMTRFSADLDRVELHDADGVALLVHEP
jgi:hypothetical protein